MPSSLVRPASQPSNTHQKPSDLADDCSVASVICTKESSPVPDRLRFFLCGVLLEATSRTYLRYEQKNLVRIWADKKDIPIRPLDKWTWFFVCHCGRGWERFQSWWLLNADSASLIPLLIQTTAVIIVSIFIETESSLDNTYLFLERTLAVVGGFTNVCAENVPMLWCLEDMDELKVCLVRLEFILHVTMVRDKHSPWKWPTKTSSQTFAKLVRRGSVSASFTVFNTTVCIV
jgi:hypothetical protein